MEKLNEALIVVVIILIGALGVSFGYMFFVKNNTTSNQTPMNITNITNVTNQTIPYSSEYITFSKAEINSKKLRSYRGSNFRSRIKKSKKMGMLFITVHIPIME